ncbi:hypothetical protein [Bradyrhizobium japonicum]|uniref:hypothetical protein n=1 Tax=Bradyrhizobium japonicum TaxID=375 RepID=UPI000462639C|nr:hypothetical protein [Bradyrhizobium japonicum]
MDRQSEPQAEMSFVIHVWLEDRVTWRGRVTLDDNKQSAMFEDAQTLIDFIDGQLRSHGVSLPMHRTHS